MRCTRIGINYKTTWLGVVFVPFFVHLTIFNRLRETITDEANEEELFSRMKIHDMRNELPFSSDEQNEFSKNYNWLRRNAKLNDENDS